jgi:rhamnosyltransferase
MNKTPNISILLLCYNGDPYLDEVLTAIYSQKTRFHFEVIAIDSGSSDRTLEIIRRYPVKLHQIPNREFGHGKTRNLGIKLASGQYVVFLTQDATPAHETWLENLVRPLVEDQCVAGVYSRQIPRLDCNPCEWRDIQLGAGPIRLVKSVNFEDEFQKKTYESHYRQFILFSNVSSCIRKEVLEQMPFNEKIIMVEDQEWCKRAIEAGYAVVYEPASAVYHSHNHPLKMIYKRHFDYGASYKKFSSLNLSFKNVFFYTLYESLCDIAFIIMQPGRPFWKLRWIGRSPLIRLAMRYGLYEGLRSKG